MSIETRGTLTSKFEWSSIDSQDNVRIVDAGNVGNTYEFVAGTGEGQTNTLFHSSGAITSSRHYTLHNLTQTLFGNTMTIDFSGGVINAIILENTSTEPDSYLTIGPGPSNPLEEPFAGNVVPVYPSGTISFVSIAGFAVDATRNEFSISNSGGDLQQYEISIIGQVV